jgi:hypothetical protein
VGGFAGMLGDEGASAQACYWDIWRSGKGASAGGVGKTSAEMALRGAYYGWDFDGVWDIDNGKGYPWLRGLAPESAPEFFFEQKRAPAPIAARPLIKVTGKAIYVNAPQGAPMQIRLVDIKGKVIAKYNVAGSAKLSLNKIPSGKYIVEAASRGRRVSVSLVRILR